MKLLHSLVGDFKTMKQRQTFEILTIRTIKYLSSMSTSDITDERDLKNLDLYEVSIKENDVIA